jgi:hypothetical protein
VRAIASEHAASKAAFLLISAFGAIRDGGPIYPA